MHSRNTKYNVTSKVVTNSKIVFSPKKFKRPKYSFYLDNDNLINDSQFFRYNSMMNTARVVKSR
jgi:hypothetical protein